MWFASNILASTSKTGPMQMIGWRSGILWSSGFVSSHVRMFCPAGRSSKHLNQSTIRMAYHPTELSLLNSSCPRALDFRQARTFYDRTIFAAGISAHAVMEVAGNEVRKRGRALENDEITQIGQEVCEKLIGEGRSYDGHSEPPLPADKVFLGRDMALKYLFRHNLSESAQCEVGFAYDKDWKPVDYYDDSARFRTILDVVDVVEKGNEEWVGRMLVVTDYKTSWRADKSELDSLQRRAQAVTVWKSSLCKDVDGIELRIVNLQTGAEYSREVWLTENGLADLRSWQSDLERMMDAADWTDENDQRPARPGLRCINCSYVGSCEESKKLVEDTDIESASPEAIANAYAASLARTKSLEAAAREASDRGQIPTDSGVVGYLEKERRVCREDTVDQLWGRWKGSGGDASGLLTSLKLGVRNIENASKKLFGRSEKADREAWVGELVDKQPYASFGVERNDK